MNIQRTPPPTISKSPGDASASIKPDDNRRKKKAKRAASTSSPEVDLDVSEEILGQISEDKLKLIITEIIKAELSKTVSEISKSVSSSILNELSLLKKEVEDFKSSMNFMEEKFDSAVKDLTNNQKDVSVIKKENEQILTTVDQLTEKINKLEQSARANNIEVQCVPETHNENPYDVIAQLGNAIGQDITGDKILHCTRVAKADRSSTRPRSIVAQLSSPRIRDNVLASVSKFNKSQANTRDKLNTSHIGIAGDITPIYVVEHLSPVNKALHAAARRKAKDNNYKHVWVKNGFIFVRKTNDSNIILIRNMEILENLK